MRHIRSLAPLALILASSTALAIPVEVSHQGRLLDSTGAAIDGSTDLAFSLYDGASGGTAVWTEAHAGTVVDGGYFSVILGSNNALDPDALDADDLYVGISVDGSELPDRVRLTASPWAIRAIHAENAGTATSLSGGTVDATTVNVGGNEVIDGDGLIDYGSLKNVPDAPALPDCSQDQLLQFQGGEWACIDSTDLSIDADQIASGTISADRLDFGSGAGQIAEGSTVYAKSELYTQADLYTRSEVDALLASLQQDDKSLGERIAGTASRNIAYTYDRDFRLVGGLAVPFTAGEGPVEIFMSVPMSGGSHSSCRPVIDGVPAAIYGGGDASYFWADGITYAADGWAMWTPTRSYSGIAPGDHLLTVECHDDSTGGDAELGNNRMVRVANVVPYGNPADSDVKSYTKSISGGQSVSTSFSSVNNLNTSFTSTGGPVKISITIPMSGGSHSTCRPLIDGVPAGQGDIDDTGYRWQEGLIRTNDNWGQWERTRIYKDVSAGTHNVTVECQTDGGSVSLGNNRMPLNLAITTYPKNSDNKSVRTYHVNSRKVERISRPWVKMSDLKLTAKVGDGPVEVGYSLPISGGSTSTCRLLVDGNANKVDHPDDLNYFWQEGLEYSVDGWIMWDMKHVFHSLSAGDHDFQVECQTDSGTADFGHTRMVSTLWAVAHDE